MKKITLGLSLLFLLSYYSDSQSSSFLTASADDYFQHELDSEYILDSVVFADRLSPTDEWRILYNEVYNYEDSGDTSIIKMSFSTFDDSQYWPSHSYWHFRVDERLVKKQEYLWNTESSSWDLYSYYTINYNDDEHYSIKTEYAYDDFLMLWKATQRTTIVHDENSNLISIMFETISGGQWIAESLDVSTYNNEDNIIVRRTFTNEYSFYTLDPLITNIYEYENNKHILSKLYLHDFNSGDSTLERLDSIHWNSDYESLRAQYRVEAGNLIESDKQYTYKDDTMRIYYKLVKYNDVWRTTNYSEFHFLNEESLNYSFNYNNDLFSGDSTAHRNSYFYKEDDNTVDSILYSTYDTPNFPGMDLSAKELYYYTEVASINEPPNTPRQVKIYPNPVNERCHIEFIPDRYTNIFVYEISGRIIDEYKVYQQDFLVIDTQDLQTGVFIIQVSNSKMNASVKLIKQ